MLFSISASDAYEVAEEFEEGIAEYHLALPIKRSVCRWTGQSAGGRGLRLHPTDARHSPRAGRRPRPRAGRRPGVHLRRPLRLDVGAGDYHLHVDQGLQHAGHLQSADLLHALPPPQRLLPPGGAAPPRAAGQRGGPNPRVARGERPQVGPRLLGGPRPLGAAGDRALGPGAACGATAGATERASPCWGTAPRSGSTCTPTGSGAPWAPAPSSRSRRGPSARPPRTG